MTAALRPMTIGEILDRTFNLYRQNFKVFIAIGMVPAVFWFLTNACFLLMTKLQPRGRVGFSRGALALSGGTLVLALIIYICGASIAHGAVAYAVSALHLGRPAGFSESYRRLRGRILRILNVAISVSIRIFGTCILFVLAAASMALIPGIRGNAAAAVTIVLVWIVVMVGCAFFVLRMSARYALSVPACILEDLPARKAIKRSVFLSKGSVIRILVVYLLFTIVNLAFGFAATVPFQLALLAVKSETGRIIVALGNQLTSSIVSAVIGPLVTIALTLLYYDERVRKEAFDVHYMMEMLDGPAPPTSGSAFAAGGSVTV